MSVGISAVPPRPPAFARLVRLASLALADLVGCAKTSEMILGEEKAVAHLHAHVDPRMRELPDDLKGTHVSSCGGDQGDRIDEAERGRLALKLRARIEPALT